jgi:hypothetical protein
MSNSRPSTSAIPSTRSVRSPCVAVIVVVSILLLGFASFGQSGSADESPRATKDRLNDRRWWPTKGTSPFKAYAGESVCLECHSGEASSQVHTPMAEASFRIKEHTPSSKLAPETLHNGSYLYRISSDNLGSKLVVSSGKQSISANISWIFGAGVRGQTYILENKDSLYESQVSSFATLHGMDLTPGHSQIEAGDLKNALGERLSTSTARLCFGCHTTFSSTDSAFDVARATPGVRCEACHGPGVDHINAMKNGEVDDGLKAILNPAHLSPVALVDFCGACHRTGVDVVMSEGAYGPLNVRFQPYRLEKSRCWGTRGDDRLTCIACHNPHEPLLKNESSYDPQCLSCHSPQRGEAHGASQSHAVCPKASANCTSCHMPKYDVPGMHANFTDHFIRVVRNGESYPN